MQLKTILNRVEKHKSFVYGKVRFRRKSGRLSLAVSLRPRRGSRPVCAGCGHRGPQYDRLAPRRFEFVPLWGLAVYFVYRMRCGLPAVWGQGGAGAVGQRTMSFDDDVSLVPGGL